MENPEEILHSLEEFAKLKPKDIPRELEEYLCFVAKTGDPVYQWPAVKSLFKEKLINVITEFYESCPSVEIPPCPNVEMFNYESMKHFIIEKLDTFAAAPFTVQRICELLTTPRKEYNRIDKYMRALEKNILVVSTTEPGNRRNTENGDGIANGIESEHITEGNSNNDINVEEMDDTPIWPRMNPVESNSFVNVERTSETPPQEPIPEATTSECQLSVEPSTSAESVITCTVVQATEPIEEKVTIEEVKQPAESEDENQPVTIVPAQVQRRRNSIEPINPDDNAVGAISETTTEHTIAEYEPKNDILISESSESSNTDSSSNDTVTYDVSPDDNVTSKSELEVDSSESLDSSDDKTEEKVDNPPIVEPVINPDTIEEPPVEKEAVPEPTAPIEETKKITEVTEEEEVVEEKSEPILQEVEAPVLTEPVVTFPPDEEKSAIIPTAPEVEPPEIKVEAPVEAETKIVEEATPMDVDVASSNELPTTDVPNDETNSI